MDFLKDKFEIISLEKIADYIDKLYEPYKVYGEVGDLKKISDDESKIIHCEINGENSFVVYSPKKYEIGKIEAFREFEYKRTKLIELRKFQEKYYDQKLTKVEADDIERNIDLIIDELSKIKKQKQVLKIDKEKKTDIKQIFKTSLLYDDVLLLLEKNNLIRLNESKIEWIGAINNPELKSKKLLCSLFFVLEDRNYLKPNPKNKHIANLLSEAFNIPISDKVYGNTKNSLSSRGANSKDEDYYNFFYFILKK